MRVSHTPQCEELAHPMANASHYKTTADEFEKLAREVHDHILRQHYKLLAEEYRELAKYYERQLAKDLNARTGGLRAATLASSSKDDEAVRLAERIVGKTAGGH
jgi:hypothetical protein